ncbi:MAG: PEP-CTERM sorting domain-containing protein [Methylotenera sp.]|nr:PEP-CTERM sorting domain-containing protein [Methylotenera sp.]
MKKLILVSLFTAFSLSANAAVIRITEGAFTPAAGLITFSEAGFPLGTTNPTYTPSDYGGVAGAPTVNFGGWFVGQSAGAAGLCPAGAAISGCVLGSPTGALALDAASPSTFTVNDGSNPTSPVLSGTPTFNGPVSILFDVDIAGVGLEGGFFNAIGGTAITAYGRDGSLLGSVLNESTGIEFLGLVTGDGLASIAGLQFSLVGAEPAGFAIDNLRFGLAGQVISVPEVPEPETYAMMMAGLGLMGFMVRRRKENRV